MNDVNYFLAVDLSDQDFSFDINKCIKEIDKNKTLEKDFDFKWTKSSSYHITLFYIGQIKNKNKLNTIIKDLSSILSEFNNFYIKIEKIEFFGKRNHSPIVLRANDENEKLIKLHNVITKYMLDNIQDAKDCSKFRKYKSHITIGRVRKIISLELKKFMLDFFSTLNKNYLSKHEFGYLVDKIKLMHLDQETKTYKTDFEFLLPNT